MVADPYDAGIPLKVAGLRLAHPDWPGDRLDSDAVKLRATFFLRNLINFIRFDL